MFSLGDKAVYPAYGVGVIESIEKKNVSGQEEQYYVIKFVDSGMRVVVPRSKAKDVGLRHVISKDMVEEVFKVFQKKSEIKMAKIPSWNKRQREYLAKLKSGSIIDLAEILKELTYIQSYKQLSFGEKKMLETVRKLLIEELACCQNCPAEVIWGKINSLLCS